jgi:ATP-dependent DNA helicase UvrD/PcrA
VYRLAWASLTGRPESEVRAAFHYVRGGRTVTPENLPGADELAALLASVQAEFPTPEALSSVSATP